MNALRNSFGQELPVIRACGVSARATVFFWVRAAHAVVYWLVIPNVLNFVFSFGYIAVAGIFWEVVR